MLITLVMMSRLLTQRWILWNEFGTWIDITTIPPVAFPIYASYDESSKVPWYGVSSNFKNNPIGNLTNNGYIQNRAEQANIALDYDMSEIVPGLKSKTYAGFNTFNLLRIGKAENYIAYIATPSKTITDNDTILLSKVHDGIDMPGRVRPNCTITTTSVLQFMRT